MEKFKRDFRDGYRASRRKAKPRGFKFWLNVATIVLIVIVLIVARGNIVKAFQEMAHANWLILLLLLPVQFASYYASTEVFLTYLRARGQLRHVNNIEATSMSLELNFINHVFPSGGVSGIGYMSWRLSKLGVSAGQSTMAQIMKYVVQMAVFMVLMVFALLWGATTNQMPNWVAVATTVAVVSLFFMLIFGSYLIGSRERMLSFADFLARLINRFVDFITHHHKKNVMQTATTEKFFLDFHEDFLALKTDKKLLVQPIVWAFLFTIFDVGLFVVAFASLGAFVNPAILFIAYGAATLSGMFMITPGGAGAYEAIMIGILTASSVAPGVAFAGVILARVILILLTLSSGFVVYQRALRKYGQPTHNLERAAARSFDQAEETAEKAESDDIDAPNAVRVTKIDFHKAKEPTSRDRRHNISPEHRHHDSAVMNRAHPAHASQTDKSVSSKIDQKFIAGLQKRQPKKLKLSADETAKLARANIADITIDKDSDDD